MSEFLPERQNERYAACDDEKTLARLEFELQEKYCEVGKCVLEWAHSCNRDIEKTVDEIIIVRRRLSRAEKELRCPSCMGVNARENRYCRHCGKRLSADNKIKENRDGKE